MLQHSFRKLTTQLLRALSHSERLFFSLEYYWLFITTLCVHLDHKIHIPSYLSKTNFDFNFICIFHNFITYCNRTWFPCNVIQSYSFSWYFLSTKYERRMIVNIDNRWILISNMQFFIIFFCIPAFVLCYKNLCGHNKSHLNKFNYA